MRFSRLPSKLTVSPWSLRVGADADITIFDPGRIIDRATIEAPARPSEGQPKALHTDAIPEQLHSVSRLRINSVQCRSRSFDEAHHRTAGEFGSRRRVCPGLFWLINRDVVPDHARTVMLSHRMGENSVSVPVLLHPRIMYPPESDGRRCAQVRRQNRFPNYEHAQMRV
jgi:hypothetical protein